ncbi:MAG: carotenoid biosynthesis protein [Methanobacterium sp.]|nr:carotenoid biosynthesis protein [Methanobacterium sp.]
MDLFLTSKTPNTKKTFNKLRWSLILVFFIFNLLFIFTYKDPNLLALDSFVATALIFIVVFLYAVERYGKKNALIFFMVTSLVSLFFENLSVLTGFPFGFYHYSPSLGVLPVPLIIIFEYFAMGYLSWILAHILTGQYSKKLEGKQIFIVPLIATFIMVMWDLTVDPISATLQGLWVWTYPGPFFGIPISNYFGWFLVVYIFLQILALYLSKYDTIKPEKAEAISNKPFWSEAPVIYGTMAMGTILSIFYVFNDITIDMALITFFTMVFVALLALINVWNNESL